MIQEKSTLLHSQGDLRLNMKQISGNNFFMQIGYKHQKNSTDDEVASYSVLKRLKVPFRVVVWLIWSYKTKKDCGLLSGSETDSAGCQEVMQHFIVSYVFIDLSSVL